MLCSFFSEKSAQNQSGTWNVTSDWSGHTIQTNDSLMPEVTSFVHFDTDGEWSKNDYKYFQKHQKKHCHVSQCFKGLFSNVSCELIVLLLWLTNFWGVKLSESSRRDYRRGVRTLLVAPQRRFYWRIVIFSGLWTFGTPKHHCGRCASPGTFISTKTKIWKIYFFSTRKFFPADEHFCAWDWIFSRTRFL